MKRKKKLPSHPLQRLHMQWNAIDILEVYPRQPRCHIFSALYSAKVPHPSRYFLLNTKNFRFGLLITSSPQSCARPICTLNA